MTTGRKWFIGLEWSLAVVSGVVSVVTQQPGIAMVFTGPMTLLALWDTFR